MQAAKFGLEASVIVRSQVPTLSHWNQYIEQTGHFDGFMRRLSVSAYVLFFYIHLFFLWQLRNSDFISGH